MGIEDRIKEEMVVDVESVLDDQFDEANELYQLYGDGTVDIDDDYEDASWKTRVLIHLVGRLYAHEGNLIETPGVTYEYFYKRFDKDDSTVRHYINDLQDESIVFKDEETDEWQIHPEALPEAIERIQSGQ